uniref:ABC transporter domain-containing protein n=1 Tax=Ascaris lumbricoides TaxID=6252 RepID=A0A9J2PXH0_ASCLU
MPVVLSLSLVMPPRPTSVNVDEWNTKKLEWYHIYVKARAPYECRRSTKKKSNLLKNEWMIRTHSISVKEILHDVSGIAYPGRLMAIMGSSGAGKTTLLNMLTQRNLANVDASGVVLVNGESISRKCMRHLSAYVQQDDCFIGTMTVREHLLFSAKLRMGKEFTDKQRLKKVEDVIIEMGLSACASTVIGTPNGLKGLSGGEKKRLSFASEVLTSPAIIFCDEPTSGLDSFMSLQVVNAMKCLAKLGMTVITTIHQPSSQVFTLFDDLCLMACGRVVYQGPADKALNHWRECGFPCPHFYNPADYIISTCGFPCPHFYNPADYIISTLAVAEGKRAECISRIAKIRGEFEKSEYGRMLNANATLVSVAKTNRNLDNGRLHDKCRGIFQWRKTRYAASWWTQFRCIFHRSTLTIIREPILLRVRFIQITIAALICSVVFFQTHIKASTVLTINGILFNAVRDVNFMFQFPCVPASTVLTINGILFNAVRDVNFMFQFPCVPAITRELPIFLRENANGIYRVDAYFLAKTSAEFPLYVALPLLYTTVVYWLSGKFCSMFFKDFGLLPNVFNYLFASLTTILITNVAISIAYAVACIFGETTIAMTYLPVFVVPMLAFGGFFINANSIPSYFKWLSYLSYFRYGFEALAINEWSGVRHIPELDFSESSLWLNIAILFAMCIVIRFIAFIALFLRVSLRK